MNKKRLWKVNSILFLLFISMVSCEEETNINDKKRHFSSASDDHPDIKSYNLWDAQTGMPPRYDGSDSGPLDLTEANEWMENFDKTNGLNEIKSHYFSRSLVYRVLSKEDCTGIRIYYATNDKGEKKLILFGVNSKGENILSEVPIIIIGRKKPGEHSDSIDLLKAKSWIENYKKENEPNGIRSHYFGKNIVSKILEQTGCEGLHIYYALNRSNERKLLIIGALADGTLMLPDASTVVDADNTIADFSFPCPSVCPPPDI